MKLKSAAPLKFFAKAFGLFFLISFGGGVLCYLLLAWLSAALLGRPYVFGALYRMFVYHYQHPFQYLAVVAFSYSLCAGLWATARGQAAGHRRWAEITLVLLVSLLAGSIMGGVLWKYHDMQAGFFPEAGRMLADFGWGAGAGLVAGPLLVALSFPLNLLALVSGYCLTDWLPRRLREGNDLG